jgi:hypothetical protein
MEKISPLKNLKQKVEQTVGKLPGFKTMLTMIMAGTLTAESIAATPMTAGEKIEAVEIIKNSYEKILHMQDKCIAMTTKENKIIDEDKKDAVFVERDENNNVTAIGARSKTENGKYILIDGGGSEIPDGYVDQIITKNEKGEDRVITFEESINDKNEKVLRVKGVNQNESAQKIFANAQEQYAEIMSNVLDKHQ